MVERYPWLPVCGQAGAYEESFFSLSSSGFIVSKDQK